MTDAEKVKVYETALQEIWWADERGDVPSSMLTGIARRALRQTGRLP